MSRAGPLRLEGKVIGADGSAVAGASVSIQSGASLPADTQTWNPSEARTTQTDPAGDFVFEGLHGGRYSLRATYQEWLGARDAVWLTSRTEPIVLRIGEATGFRVQVIDADRRPIAGAKVLVASEGMTATTDAKGEARLRPLNPSQYAIEVTATGYAPGRVLAQTGAIGTIGFATITLHRGPSVAGRVVDEQGQAIAAARVFAATSPYLPTDATESAITGVDGAFTIPAVEPGLQWLHAVDGTHAPSSTSILELEEDAVGVEIVMKPGRVVTGAVVDPDGAPVPHAHVRLSLPHTKTRPLSTDINGVFVLRGRAPTLHQLYADAEIGVSQPELIDLAQDVRDLRLVLESVENSISGVVVDDTGTPMPYVTVHAMSTGVQSSGNTDARGKFSISGLRSGPCMLFADRFGRLRRPWATSAVGDTDVQLTLPRTGAIKGRVAFADGSTPTSFTVRGVVWDVHGEHGDFEIRDLPPGSFTLTINGAGFVDTTTESVLVESDKTTELGTVSLDRGRTVSGVVVDGAGRAVIGAKVVIGMAPFADLGSHEEHRLGYRSALSGADGAFSISAVAAKTNIGPSQLAVGADHPIHGRSLPIGIPEGDDDPPSISLRLRPCGSISGGVTQRDKPVTHTVIGCGWPELACAITDHDGAFLMPRLPEGTFTLRTLPTESLRSHHTTVHVVGGQRTALTIDVPVGTVTVTVAAQPQPGHQVSVADFFLFAGEVSFATRQQLISKLFTDGYGLRRWRADALEAVTFDKLVPGNYTICTVPLVGDPDDPAFEQRLADSSSTLAVFCTPVRVEAAPTEQLVSVSVPSPT